MIRLGNRRGGDHLAQEVRAFLLGTGLRNVFNPSVVLAQGVLHVCFRAFGPEGTKPFHAYYGCKRPGHAWELQSLTEICHTWGASPVADPKLCAVNGSVAVTFNTGTPGTGDNDLYLMDLSPRLQRPRRCLLEGRQRIEKNWGFADGPSGLVAVYSLAPLSLLRVVDQREDRITFAPMTAQPTGAHRPSRRIGMGTQPWRSPDGDLLMVAHEKLWVGRKRAYAGRPVRLTGVDEGSATLTMSRSRLIHTLRDALPQCPPVHNPNLFSATYFAGLTAARGDYVVSYGVNDVRFGIATVGADLWR